MKWDIYDLIAYAHHVSLLPNVFFFYCVAAVVVGDAAAEYDIEHR